MIGENIAKGAAALAMALVCCTTTPALADDDDDKKGHLRISGYVQGQFQWGQEDAELRVGTGNETPGQPFSRFGIRRGRLKATYHRNVASAVVQIDVSTEKGVILKDAYIDLREPWLHTFALRAGVFNRPFGREIEISSSERETPERAHIFTTLFPDERDLGAMLMIQAPEDSPWHIMRLHAGLFAGNAAKQDNDSRKDFIGHLEFNHEWEATDFELGAGVSYYHGFVYQGTESVYTMSSDGFAVSTSPYNKGRYAIRQYIGFDLYMEFDSVLGETEIRGEYLFGRQPGSLTSSKSPNTVALPASDTYIRPFRGGYVMLAHEIADTPIEIALKYDIYDPNTLIAGNELGTKGTGITDAIRSAFGFGATWHITDGMKITAYYDIVRNETSENLAEAATDLRDNMFTLRLQYKF